MLHISSMLGQVARQDNKTMALPDFALCQRLGFTRLGIAFSLSKPEVHWDCSRGPAPSCRHYPTSSAELFLLFHQIILSAAAVKSEGLRGLAPLQNQCSSITAFPGNGDDATGRKFIIAMAK